MKNFQAWNSPLNKHWTSISIANRKFVWFAMVGCTGLFSSSSSSSFSFPWRILSRISFSRSDLNPRIESFSPWVYNFITWLGCIGFVGLSALRREDERRMKKNLRSSRETLVRGTLSIPIPFTNESSVGIFFVFSTLSTSKIVIFIGGLSVFAKESSQLSYVPSCWRSLKRIDTYEDRE